MLEGLLCVVTMNQELKASKDERRYLERDDCKPQEVEEYSLITWDL